MLQSDFCWTKFASVNKSVHVTNGAPYFTHAKFKENQIDFLVSYDLKSKVFVFLKYIQHFQKANIDSQQRDRIIMFPL